MYLKFESTNGPSDDAMTLVECNRFQVKYVPKNAVYEKVDFCFLDSGSNESTGEAGKVPGRLFIKAKHGQQTTTILADGPMYVMGEDGKTVDTIHCRLVLKPSDIAEPHTG